jgi:hypothetical protein
MLPEAYTYEDLYALSHLRPCVFVLLNVLYILFHHSYSSHTQDEGCYQTAEIPSRQLEEIQVSTSGWVYT